MSKLITNKYFKFFLYIVPILLNLVLILFISKALGNGFLNNNDTSIFLTKTEAYKRFFTLWTENNLGNINSIFVGINYFSHLFSFILLKLNLSIKFMELILFFIVYTGIFYSSWYAFCLIQKKVFEENNSFLFPFLASFFYTYNLFILSLSGMIEGIFLLQMLFPYLLYILITHLNKEINLKYIFVLGLIIGLTINVAIFSFAVYLCLFLPFFFLKKNLLKTKNILSFMLIFLIAFLLAGPLIYALIHAYFTPDPYSTGTIDLGRTTYIISPYGIMGVLQFFFNWTIPLLNTYSNLYFRNNYGLLSSYMIWILILTILIIYWRSIKNKRVLLFLMLSLVLAMFLSKGIQAPLAEFNMLMYNLNPIFAIFRTSSTKFGIPIMLILSTLILYSLNINKKRLLTILVIVTVFMQTWVFFNPINFIGEDTAWWNKSVVKISQDYKDLISFINTDKKNGTVLFYPGLGGGHYDLKNGVRFSFQDVLGKYIERPIIYPDSLWLSLAKKITAKIIKDFDSKLVGDSSIRYIIVRQDFDINRMNEKAEVNRTLRILKTKDYKKVFSSKLFTVFEVNDKYFKDIITIRTPNQEYTPVFQKIAPYHYVVKTKIRDILGNQIIFRNNYHPDWRILDIEKQGLKAKQTLVDKFANGWKIEALNDKNILNLDQNIELNIYFYPQKILFFLSIVSLISLGCILTTYLFLLIKKRRSDKNSNN